MKVLAAASGEISKLDQIDARLTETVSVLNESHHQKLDLDEGDRQWKQRAHELEDLKRDRLQWQKRARMLERENKKLRAKDKTLEAEMQERQAWEQVGVLTHNCSLQSDPSNRLPMHRSQYAVREGDISGPCAV